MRVAVIGCGSAGPATALALARAGHEVVLYERSPTLAPVGAGLLLQPTGQWVLRELGLLEQALGYAGRVERLISETHAGRRLLDLRYTELGRGVVGLGVHRATLLDLLVRAACAAGVELRLDAAIVRGERRGEAWWLESSRNAKEGPFELLVIANGAQSNLRAGIGLRFRARPYPWGALWTIVEDRERSFGGELYQVVDGVEKMVGFLDTGSRSDAPAPAPLVSIFWSVQTARVAEVRARGAGALRDEIVRLVPRAAPLLEGVVDMQHWTYAGYLDVRMRHWHGPGVVVLGDAAHAMSPQLGQGVNLALWDAWTLARCLAAERDIATALARYSALRRAHLRFYQRVTRWLTPLFQSSLRPAGWLRDLAFPALSRLPWVQQQMLRGMAGLKLGFLRRSIDLDPT
jgi:2-polyprenyl-6-methoxyphenol hydroxylase-like FAD-dependent oxidoreductase